MAVIRGKGGVARWRKVVSHRGDSHMDGGLKVAGRHTRIVWVPEREEHAITALDALIP